MRGVFGDTDQGLRCEREKRGGTKATADELGAAAWREAGEGVGMARRGIRDEAPESHWATLHT